MKSWDINGFLVMLLPIVIMLVMGAMGIIWIVMAQRTKRQAIAAGLSGEQYQGLGPRWLLFQAGVLMLALGIALAIIGGFKLDPEGALAWAAILLACGSSLVLNHLLVSELRSTES